MQIDLKPDISLLFIMLIFWANYFIVRKYFLRPINQLVSDRQNEIEDADRRYEESLSRFNEATTSMEARLHQAKKDATQVREKHRASAAGFRSQLVEKTRDQADGIAGEAEGQLKTATATARQQIVSQSESLARYAAEQILGRKLA